MKYNFHEVNRDMQNVFAHIATELTKNEFEKLNPSAIDIELKIEGKEINFLEFISSYFAQIDWLAEQRAKDLLKNRLAETDDILYEIGEYLKEKLALVSVLNRKEVKYDDGCTKGCEEAETI